MLVSHFAGRSGRLLGLRYLSEATVTHPESRTNLPTSVKTHLEGRNRFLLPVYDRPPVIFEKGHGMHIWDSEGRKYLDFSAGIAVNALGHSDEGVVEVNSWILLPGKHNLSHSIGAKDASLNPHARK